MKVVSYRDLVVWQKAMELVVAIYSITETFPTQERYGLSAQMRRAAVSIASNIAEGSRRGTKKDFRHFLLTAYGSGAELETQCEIVARLPWGAHATLDPVLSTLDEVMRMLNRMTVNMHEHAVE